MQLSQSLPYALLEAPAEDSTASASASWAAAEECLEIENSQLRELVAELTEESREAQDQLQALRAQLAASTQGIEPILQSALLQERAIQEARNARVLHLLEAKDKTIRQLEAGQAAAKHRVQELAEEADELRRKYAVADARITDLLQTQAKARRASNLQKQEYVQAHERLTAEIVALKETAKSREKSQGADVPKISTELEAVKGALESSESHVLDLQKQQHNTQAQSELLVKQIHDSEQSGIQLQRFSSCLGKALEAALGPEVRPALANYRQRQQDYTGDAASEAAVECLERDLNDLLAKAADLQAAPRKLEQALAENARLQQALQAAKNVIAADTQQAGAAESKAAAKCAALEPAIKLLRQQIRALNSRIEKLQAEAAAASAAADSSQRQEAESKRRLGAALAAAKKMKQQLAEQGEKLGRNEAQRNTLQEALREMEGKHAALEKEVQQMQAKGQATLKQQPKSQAHLTQLQAEIETLKRERDEALKQSAVAAKAAAEARQDLATERTAAATTDRVTRQKGQLLGISAESNPAIRTAACGVRTTFSSAATQQCVYPEGKAGDRAGAADPRVPCTRHRDAELDTSSSSSAEEQEEEIETASLPTTAPSAAQYGGEAAAGLRAEPCSACRALEHHVVRLRQQLAAAEETGKALRQQLNGQGCAPSSSPNMVHEGGGWAADKQVTALESRLGWLAAAKNESMAEARRLKREVLRLRKALAEHSDQEVKSALNYAPLRNKGRAARPWNEGRRQSGACQMLAAQLEECKEGWRAAEERAAHAEQQLEDMEAEHQRLEEAAEHLIKDKKEEREQLRREASLRAAATAAESQKAEAQLRAQLQRRAQEVRAAQERFADYRAAKGRQVELLEARLLAAVQLAEPCCPACGALRRAHEGDTPSSTTASPSAASEVSRRRGRLRVRTNATPTPREADCEDRVLVAAEEPSGETIAAAEGLALDRRLKAAAQLAADERQAEKENQSLQTQLQDTLAALSNAQEASSQLAALQAQLAMAHDALEREQQAKSSLEARLADAESASGAKENQVHELKKQVEELQAALSIAKQSAARDSQESQTRMADLVASAQLAKAASTKAEARAEELASEVEALRRSSLEAAVQAAAAVQEKHGNLQKELQDREASLRQASAELTQALSAVEAAKGEEAKSRTRLAGCLQLAQSGGLSLTAALTKSIAFLNTAHGRHRQEIDETCEIAELVDLSTEEVADLLAASPKTAARSAILQHLATLQDGLRTGIEGDENPWEPALELPRLIESLGQLH